MEIIKMTKHFSEFLTELKQNQIFKDIKTIQNTTQYQYSLNLTPLDYKIAEHLLKSTHSMKIGYEFECYLKSKADSSPIDKLDDNLYDNELKAYLKTANEYYTLATLLSTKLKTSVKAFTSYHAFEKDSSTTWYVEPDSTLDETIPSKEYFPVEIVSKTYPANEFKSIFENLKSALEENGYNPITSKSTGLHCNLSFVSQDVNSQINLLKLVVIGQDNFWSKKIGRDGSHFCRSQLSNVENGIKILVPKLKKIPTSIEELKKNKKFLKDLEKYIKIKKEEKHWSINFSKYNSGKGWIEIRIPGGDYFGTTKARNLNLIEWYLYMFIASTSDQLWETEYLSWILSKINLISEKK